ncbi:phosphoribosylformylglycinamidine cyclo-ligase [Merdibacter massiliensis]|uniref:phosphoribosylformylglycinamidine cyclo-ligase n=1 Tax=Merdibacter massiliensis TaxID=1871030 RepID=UPI00096AC8C6|nr:phosphoribosylformylglycinamidine cyclo-ligase [Merdibacter massiliensis]
MSDKYREAGVDLEAGYESVRRIKSHVARTKTMGAIDSIGAFGGMFDLSKYGLKEPVLVSGTDGVGTKLMIAFDANKHDTIGIDAVAMCVNDVLVQGAAPIFFLDYIAVGKNHPEVIEQIVKGVADGCVQAECALIGGETAEMPDMYDIHHYDIAGFCVGAVDKCNLLDGQKIEAGNVLIGLPSSGCHSNGFSLIRKVLLKDAGLDLHQTYPEFNGKTLGEELLTPTKIYVKAIKHLLGKVDIKGMSHITGGGFYENVPRMLKEGQGVTIDLNSYPSKPIFDLIAKTGNIEKKEMCNVFNMGIGFILAVDQADVKKVQELLAEVNEPSYVIGEVTASGSVDLKW